MNYLLDTCVISEPTKSAPNANVLRWLDESEEELFYLSVLTLGELENGVERLPASRKKEKIRQWIDLDLRQRFEGRILNIDADVALRWGQITARCAASGHPLPVIDGLLAATALVHDMTIVTRNASDFRVADLLPAGVKLLDPWAL